MRNLWLILTLALVALLTPFHVPPAHAETLPLPDSCALRMPSHPLTAAGLAVPYRLSGLHDTVCHESDPNQAAFVEAVILDPATGALAVYHPLVIDDETRPAITPVVPTLPAHAVVALWFGSNGNELHLTHVDEDAGCVNGVADSDFGQVAACHASAFFRAAAAAMAAGKLVIPALGVAHDGLPCPTTRDFLVVDQDPADNVVAKELIAPDGRMAQNTAANQQAFAQHGWPLVTVNNGSDEGLLTGRIDPALGCAPWRAPDLANLGGVSGALALNELQAAADQQAPVALVPERDPMTLVNGQPNLAKLNRYRALVDQPAEPTLAQAAADQAAFCQNLLTLTPSRLTLDALYFQAVPAPSAAFANLYDFLLNRYAFTVSADGLNCGVCP